MTIVGREEVALKKGGAPYEAFDMLMQAKSAHEAAVEEKALPAQSEMLVAVLLAGGAPLDELPPMLRGAISSSVGEDGNLPPVLAAVQKPLYALAYKMAAEHVFKESFVSLVYEKLSDYEPKKTGYRPPGAGQRELL